MERQQEIVCDLLNDDTSVTLNDPSIDFNLAHGLKQNDETEIMALQLLSMLDNWTEALETGGQIDTIYTDYEKAFNKVPHKRLLDL